MLDPSAPDYETETFEISDFGAVQWKGGSGSSALAEYNTEYTMLVEVTLTARTTCSCVLPTFT